MQPSYNVADGSGILADMRMAHRSAIAVSAVDGSLDLPGNLGDSSHLLSTLYKSSVVGVAICDRQLRFRAINDALASMNGLPARAHIGKTIYDVLGQVAEKIEPAFQYVFNTGRPLSNFQVTAKLPERATPAHWNGHYFLLKDEASSAQYVGAVVLELPRRGELGKLISQLTNHLAMLGSSLRASLVRSGTSRVRPQERPAGSLGLLQACFKDVQMVSALLSSAPSHQALQPGAAALDRNSARMMLMQDALTFIAPLSSREREVIALLASGKSNREIAGLLSISVRTVETHRAKIMLKLGLRSLSDLVRYALRNQLVPS